MREGPIKTLIEAALRIRVLLMSSNCDIEGAEVIIRLRRREDVEKMRCEVKADPLFLREIPPGDWVPVKAMWPFAGLRFSFEEKTDG